MMTTKERHKAFLKEIRSNTLRACEENAGTENVPDDDEVYEVWEAAPETIRMHKRSLYATE